MDATYRGLGFDPTPGDPDAAVASAAALTDAAAALAEAEQAMRSAAAATQDWTGDAAQAFRASVEHLPRGLAGRQDALRALSTLLTGWAQTLAADKRTAEELDARAVAVRRELASANDDLHERRNALDLAATPALAATAEAAHAAASGRVADLDAELRAVLDEAARLRDEHGRAADAVADQLDALRSGERQVGSDAGDQLAEALTAMLDQASRASSVLGSLLAASIPAQVPPAAAAVADGIGRAGFGGPPGELIIFGEQALAPAGARGQHRL